MSIIAKKKKKKKRKRKIEILVDDGNVIFKVTSL